MSEELNEILNSLSEEEKKSFIEKVKEQAKNAVKAFEEKKKQEEEQKKFKATGHWESEDNEIKMTADIKEDNKDTIEFTAGKTDDPVKFSMKKNEFFNFFKMLEEVNSFVKEEENLTIPASDPWFEYINDIAKSISNASRLCSPCRRSRIFHIR